MDGMQEGSATLPVVRLFGLGQVYVATVGAMAVASLLSDSWGWYVALVVLALPLSLLALWVSFYGVLAVGFVIGHDPAQLSWPVALVWVGVWTTTAWVNAHLGQKVLETGWRTIAPRPPAEHLDD